MLFHGLIVLGLTAFLVLLLKKNNWDFFAPCFGLGEENWVWLNWVWLYYKNKFIFEGGKNHKGEEEPQSCVLGVE